MWINKIVRKVRIGIRGAIYLNSKFKVSYFQLLRSFFSKDKLLAIPIKNLSVTTDIYRALYVSNVLWNIEKYGWKLCIDDVSDDLVIYENKQKGMKIYSRIDDALG